jgi:hypothetical protein
LAIANAHRAGARHAVKCAKSFSLPLRIAETLVYSYSEWRKVIHRKGGEGTRAHKIGKFSKISLSFPIFSLFFMKIVFIGH